MCVLVKQGVCGSWELRDHVGIRERAVGAGKHTSIKVKTISWAAMVVTGNFKGEVGVQLCVASRVTTCSSSVADFVVGLAVAFFVVVGGLVEFFRARVRADRRTLAVCAVPTRRSTRAEMHSAGCYTSWSVAGTVVVGNLCRSCVEGTPGIFLAGGGSAKAARHSCLWEHVCTGYKMSHKSVYGVSLKRVSLRA